MRKVVLSTILLLMIIGCERPAHYAANQPPLARNEFIKLPLGAIKPQGWLEDQLVIQANGLTGHLDEFWPSLENSGWKGGDGEIWERGPYYLDGLIPLAYQLGDSLLVQKARVWVEWILASGQPDGWFGPAENNDRWPLAVAMKVLTQYYEATGDERVISLLTNYFAYLKNAPPDWPDHTWRGVRAKENLISAFWLYNRTKNANVLEVAKSIVDSSYDWSAYFRDFPWDSEALASGRIPHIWDATGLTAHVVNIAMAVKYPGLRYILSKDRTHRQRVFEGIENLDRHHGQAGGRFSGDEHLSGRRPTQGTELCAVVEFMYSLEKLVEIIGAPQLADRLEVLAYNSLPGATTADYWAHQYDQQSNQVLCTIAEREWSSNGPQSNLYGLEPNYGCCTANMHQGWPKFVAHMWMATRTQGLAVIAYGPSQVNARVGRGVAATIIEETRYPFEGRIKFTVMVAEPTTFPLYFRIPVWAEGATILVGNRTIPATAGSFAEVKREWEAGDTVELQLPMELRTETRYNNSVAIMRGPLYFSLKIGERFAELKNYYLNSSDWEVYPTTAWNYGLVVDREHPGNSITVYIRPLEKVPWVHENAPVVLEVLGKAIPQWGIVNHSADDPPVSPVTSDQPAMKLELVPYGSTRLRITEFPVIAR
ncbi:MAG: beta-L-arabinofuranosidase domain-containing protein [Candidatus Neomarinimicrobiota bacterium]